MLETVNTKLPLNESLKPALTPADVEALALLPDSGWFEFRSLPFDRPNYRCESLELAGALESRVVGEYPVLHREYRRVKVTDK